MVSVPSSLGMTSGQIALRILRGRERGEDAGHTIGQRRRPASEHRADKALATIMRIVVNGEGVMIQGANKRSSVSYGGPGWKLAIKGDVEVGNGSASVGGAHASGFGAVRVSTVQVAATLDGEYSASDFMASAEARGGVSLDAAGVSVSAYGMGDVAAHVEQHAHGRASSGFTDVYADSAGDVSMSVMAFPSDGLMRVYAGDGSDTVSVVAGKLAGVFGEAGDDTMSITSLSGAYDAIDNVDGGKGDDTIAISSRGGVNRTSLGEGDDVIAIAAAGRVDLVDGGDGDDAIAISTSTTASGIYGGDGNDSISIAAGESAGSVDGADGDDVISLTSQDTVGYAKGGDGNDVITASAAREVRGLFGGEGNDTIRASSASIERISGGKGDDLIVLDSTAGKASTVFFGEGDGHDTIETNGPLDIRRVSEDGTKTLDMTKAIVSRNHDGTATISFEGSNDTITVRFTGAMATGAFTVRQEKDRLVIGPAAAG